MSEGMLTPEQIAEWRSVAERALAACTLTNPAINAWLVPTDHEAVKEFTAYTLPKLPALLAHLDAVAGEKAAIEKLYTAMCDRLHDACVRHGLGLGGEHVDHLVIDALATLTRERDEARKERAALEQAARDFIDCEDTGGEVAAGQALDALRATLAVPPAPAPTEAR